MPRFTRRRPNATTGSGDGTPDATDRRSFLRASGGLAAGAVVLAVPSGVLATSADAAPKTPAPGRPAADPETEAPDAPVMAYIHDRKAGTVVIMTGDKQRTVKDRELVRRLTVVPKKARREKRRARRSMTARG